MYVPVAVVWIVGALGSIGGAFCLLSLSHGAYWLTQYLQDRQRYYRAVAAQTEGRPHDRRD